MPSRAVPPKPEVLRGTVGLVVPSLDELAKRLEYAGKEMKRVVPETHDSFPGSEEGRCVEATCPWGNRVRCHAPSPEFGRIELGIVYVDFDVPHGTADGIARFYSEVMRAPAKAQEGPRHGQRRPQPEALSSPRRRRRCPSTTTTTSRSTSPTSLRPTNG